MFNKPPGASEERKVNQPDRPQFENIRATGEELEKGETKCAVLDMNA